MSRSFCTGTGNRTSHLLLHQRHLLVPCFWNGRPRRSLTVRSSQAPATAEYNRVLSSIDSHKLELLQDITHNSYQLLANCDANAQMQDEDMASLLLRVTAFHRLWCQQHADADRRLCDINNMISKIALMTRLLAGGSSQNILQTIE